MRGGGAWTRAGRDVDARGMDDARGGDRGGWDGRTDARRTDARAVERVDENDGGAGGEWGAVGDDRVRGVRGWAGWARG